MVFFTGYHRGTPQFFWTPNFFVVKKMKIGGSIFTLTGETFANFTNGGPIRKSLSRKIFPKWPFAKVYLAKSFPKWPFAKVCFAKIFPIFVLFGIKTFSKIEVKKYIWKFYLPANCT